MPQRCLLLIFLLICCHPHPAEARAGKTGDLIIISGGNNSEYWREHERYLFDDQEGYFALGTIALIPRSLKACPLEVEVWGQGVTNVAFFDLTPLVGILDGTKNGGEVRRLLMNPANPPAAAGQTDRDGLRALVEKETAAPQENTLRLKRQVALDQMTKFNLTSFDELWGLYEAQRRLVEGSLLSGVDQNKLLQLYPAAVGRPAPTAAPGPRPPASAELLQLYSAAITLADPDAGREKPLPALARLLREQKLLAPVLRTQLFGTKEPHLVGYIFRLPYSALKKTTGQILVGAGEAEAAALTVNLEMERVESIFVPWSTAKFFGAILTPVVTGLVGTLLGTIIGFLVFLIQQRHLRDAEVEKKFEEKKIEHSQAIREFFSDEYKLYLGPGTEEQEFKNVTLIRKSLIDNGIYAVLPRKDIIELNRICRRGERFEGAGARLGALDRLLNDRFGELMD